MTVSILVVDDEPDVADLFRQRFRRETFVPGAGLLADGAQFNPALVTFKATLLDFACDDACAPKRVRSTGRAVPRR
jgi:hypothetical protein